MTLPYLGIRPKIANALQVDDHAFAAGNHVGKVGECVRRHAVVHLLNEAIVAVVLFIMPFDKLLCTE
jgi:hypothetical protein